MDLGLALLATTTSFFRITFSPASMAFVFTMHGTVTPNVFAMGLAVKT